MNKNEDYEIYYASYQQLSPEATFLRQRKILQTRILKVSSWKSEQLYGKIGSELLESGKLQESLLPLKRATVVWPHNVDPWINLATALFKLEKENEGLMFLMKALCFSPSAYRLHNFIIKTFEERDRLDDLENFYEETAKGFKDPNSIPVFYYPYTCSASCLWGVLQILIVLQNGNVPFLG